LSFDNSNHTVVKGADVSALSELEAETAAETRVRREIEIEAPPEDVWESLATDEGRGRWLEDDLGREIHVEVADEPSRLVWWWWQGDEPATRVEFLVVAAPAGTRVVVTETVPRFPLTAFAQSFALVLA
jgi:uncharacterized protein YndB with AHSA1/START domain